MISELEEEKVGDKAEIKAGAKLKVLFNSLFVNGSTNLDSKIGAYTSGENFIKTTISNVLNESGGELLQISVHCRFHI